MFDSFVYEDLDSRNAKFEKNWTNLQQGEEQALPSRGVQKFLFSFFVPSVLLRKQKIQKVAPKTFVEKPSSLVHKNENSLLLSFIVLKKIKFFGGNSHFFISASRHCVPHEGGRIVKIPRMQLRAVTAQSLAFICTRSFFIGLHVSCCQYSFSYFYLIINMTASSIPGKLLQLIKLYSGTESNSFSRDCLLSVRPRENCPRALSQLAC